MTEVVVLRTESALAGLSKDERFGLELLFGFASVSEMSFDNVQRGTLAVAALAERLGLDLRELGRAYLEWRTHR